MWHALKELLLTTHIFEPTIIMGDFNSHLPDSYTYDIPVSPCYSLPCKPLRANPLGPTVARSQTLPPMFGPDICFDIGAGILAALAWLACSLGCSMVGALFSMCC